MVHQRSSVVHNNNPHTVAIFVVHIQSSSVSTDIFTYFRSENQIFQIQYRKDSGAMNFSTDHDHNQTLAVHSNLSLRSMNCSLSTAEHFTLNGVPLIILLLECFAQLFNLLIFTRWRHKEPYMLYHTSLAVVSLALIISAYVNIFTRLGTWNAATVALATVSSGVFDVLNRLTFVNALFISADRWLSIEFALAYRKHISKPRVQIVTGWLSLGVWCFVECPGLDRFSGRTAHWLQRPFQFCHGRGAGPSRTDPRGRSVQVAVSNPADLRISNAHTHDCRDDEAATAANEPAIAAAKSSRTDQSRGRPRLEQFSWEYGDSDVLGGGWLAGCRTGVLRIECEECGPLGDVEVLDYGGAVPVVAIDIPFLFSAVQRDGQAGCSAAAVLVVLGDFRLRILEFTLIEQSFKQSFKQSI